MNRITTIAVAILAIMSGCIKQPIKPERARQPEAIAVTITPDQINRLTLEQQRAVYVYDSILKRINTWLGFSVSPTPPAGTKSKEIYTTMYLVDPISHLDRNIGSCTGHYGMYHAYAGASGGMFGSKFISTFVYSQNGISQFHLDLAGLTANWSWKTEDVWYNDTEGVPMSGTAYGTATYSFASFQMTYMFRMDFTVVPSNCQFHYNWTVVPNTFNPFLR